MAKKRLTLRDKLRQKQQTTFVGRTEQLTAFQDNLMLDADSEDFVNIFNLHGQGGVGKTTLLRKFEAHCKRKDVLTAYTDEGVRDVVDFMAAVAKELEISGRALKKFNERYKVYRQKKQELEADPKAPEGLAAFMTRSILKSSVAALKSTPANPFIEMVDTDGLVKHAGEWASYVTKKIGNKDEVQLVLEPIAILTPIWLEDLVKIAEDQRVCLLIDTYELVSKFLDEWLYKVVDNRYADFDANILLTIAGRKPLDENRWSIYAEFCAAFPVYPFTEEEANTFLDQRKITAEPVRAAIKKLSGNVPVLIATLAKASPTKVEELDDISHLAVDRFLKWVDDPGKKAAALYGALPQELNIDVLKQILEPDTAATAFNWLQGMPFVQKRAKQWAYHPVVREQMLKYLRLRSMEEWSQKQHKLYTYYESKRSSLGVKQEEQYKHEKWREYALGMLHHGFCEQPEVYLTTALNEFVAALDEKRSFALEIAQTLRDAEKEAEVAMNQHWGKALEEALEAYDSDQYDKLEIVLKKMLSSGHLENEQLPLAMAWRANCLRLSEKKEEAITLFTKSIEMRDDYEWAIALRGKAYADNGLYELALKDFEKAIELEPNDKWNLLQAGNIYFIEGNNQKALKLFTQAIDLDINYVTASAMRALTYHQLNRYEDALVDFGHAIELNPEYDSAIASRGDTYCEMGKYEKALADFSRAIEIDPENEWAIAKRGEAHRQMGKYEEALADFSRAIEIDPEYEWAIAKRGETYFQMDRYEKALKDFSRAIEIDPEYDLAIAHRGVTYLQMGKYEEALIDFNRAVELDSSYKGAITNRGFTYRQIGRYEEALADFDRAIEIDPEFEWAIANRGETHRQMGKYEKALADFGRAIELDPEDKWAIAKRGETHRQMGKYEKALADFGRAIELDPEDKWVIATRGETYLLKDSPEEAILLFQKAAQLNKEEDWPHYMLHLCHLKLSDKNDKHLKQALALAQETLVKEERNQRIRFNLALYLLLLEKSEDCHTVFNKALETGANLKEVDDFVGDLKFYLKLFPDAVSVQEMLEWAEEQKEAL